MSAGKPIGKINTKKYHVFAPMGISVRINLPLFSTVVPAIILYYIIAGTTVENKGKLILTIGKTPPKRPKRRWEENIRIDVNEIVVSTRKRIDSAQKRDYWWA